MKLSKLFIALWLVMVVETIQAETIEMKVNGLVCGFCAQGIEKTLRKNPATADVIVSLENRIVALSTKEGADIPDVELTRALTNAGYEVKSIERTTNSIETLRALFKATK